MCYRGLGWAGAAGRRGRVVGEEDYGVYGELPENSGDGGGGAVRWAAPRNKSKKAQRLSLAVNFMDMYAQVFRLGLGDVQKLVENGHGRSGGVPRRGDGRVPPCGRAEASRHRVQRADAAAVTSSAKRPCTGAPIRYFWSSRWRPASSCLARRVPTFAYGGPVNCTKENRCRNARGHS